MPARTPKACRKQGCIGTSTAKHGYCDAHADLAKRDQWKGSGKGRGGRPWRRKRDEVKKRASGLCELCIRNGLLTPGGFCDHIVPLAQGGSDSILNLQWLCKPCHDAKTAEESKHGALAARTQGGGR